jgi:hypothetical protein
MLVLMRGPEAGKGIEDVVSPHALGRVLQLIFDSRKMARK